MALKNRKISHGDNGTTGIRPYKCPLSPYANCQAFSLFKKRELCFWVIHLLTTLVLADRVILDWIVHESVSLGKSRNDQVYMTCTLPTPCLVGRTPTRGRRRVWTRRGACASPPPCGMLHLLRRLDIRVGSAIAFVVRQRVRNSRYDFAVASATMTRNTWLRLFTRK